VKLFVSPHNDDEVLFGAFTLMTEKPYVAVVYDSYIQDERGLPGCYWKNRRSETIAACAVLGIPSEHIFFLGFPDNKPEVPGQIASRLLTVKHLVSLQTNPAILEDWETVYAPVQYSPKGNAQHNKVGIACAIAFSASQLKFYHTYTASGKVIGNKRVPVPENMPAVQLKLRALAEYTSQLAQWSTRDHFLREQYEYMEE
jgi:LmbE family N-acetylglucosaminyl deacetylase